MERFAVIFKGETLKLPVSKNLFAKDIIICTDVAKFSTSKPTIVYIKRSYNKTDPQEDTMMRVRWNTFTFTHQFLEENQKKVNALQKMLS